MDLTSEMLDEVMVVSLHVAKLDASNAGEFKIAIKELIVNSNKVVLDITPLRFIDSSGLGAILSCLRLTTHEGGDLKICGMSQSVRLFFELVRMHKIIEIFNDRDEALRAFSLGVSAGQSH